MKYLTLLKANIKSQRGSFIGISIIIFIITISLCAVLSIRMNANAYEAEQIERIGYGDMTYWIMNVPDREKLLEQIDRIEEVESVEVGDIVCFEKYVVRGSSETTVAADSLETEVTGTFHIIDWTGKEDAYHIYQEDFTQMQNLQDGLIDGGIYVSPAFLSLYKAKIGDVIEITPVEGEEAECFTILGYFEDPVAGSALMGIKQALITKADKERLAARIEAAGERAKGWNGSVFHVTKKADAALTAGAFQKRLNEETDLAQVSAFSYTKSTMMGFMLILQNLFSGILLVFVAALFIVAMIIIGHSISSSIEQDYTDMGILKALGYTRTDLRIVQLLQYLTAVLGAMLLGVPVSLLLVKVINKMTVTVVGLLIPAKIPAGATVLSLSLILLIMMGFVCAKTSQIGKITPIRAIRGGAEDVYFKSRFSAPIHKRGLSFFLAYRQLISGKKQYYSAALVSALLVFFLSLLVRLGAWLGPDGKGLMDAFAASRYDLGIMYIDEKIQKEAEAFIESRAGIEASYQYKMERASVNQTEYLLNVISEPEYFNMIKGRTCLYQNELVMTQAVAEEVNVGIGEYVSVNVSGKDMDFIVSGIYQCANDMGANFAMNKEGYERFLEEDEKTSYWQFYLLKDDFPAEKMAEELRESYGGRIEADTNTWSGVEAIVAAASSLTTLMFVITIVFILVTVALTGSKILYREQHDLGIYKSLGFASGRLRCAFALRFIMTALLGSILGVFMSACFTDPLASAMLKFGGISSFTSSLTPVKALTPLVFVSALFFAFAYLAAGKIKKTEPGILIIE